jgi:UDP-glucose 4-epimerase
MAESLRGVDVLVTGATGFLGSHLTRRLVHDGARVHVFARHDSSFARLADVSAQLTCWTGDLGDGAAIDRCLDEARPRIVFHLAGFAAGRSWHPGAASDALLATSYEVNVGGTLRLLTAVARNPHGITRVIRTGGLEEYGRGPLPFREEQREAPISAYSASQVAATHLAEMLHRQLELPVVTLRPALAYGPGQAETFFIPSLIRACLAGSPFEMSAGSQTRDLIYVDDVIEACVRAGTAPGIDGQVINVGSGQEHRIRDIAERVVRLTGGRTALRIGVVTPRGPDLERLVCDPSRAARLLDWQADTLLEEGLTRTIAWHRRAGSSSLEP